MKSVNKIRDARLRRSWSQDKLAAEIERDRTQISAWERSDRTPAITTLRRIARALGCSVVDLLPDEDRIPVGRPENLGGAS
jgi:transcriptional regulator with XRE-family HTH domain